MYIGRVAAVMAGAVLVGAYVIEGHVEALIAGVALLFPGAGPTKWSIKTGLISVEVFASDPASGISAVGGPFTLGAGRWTPNSRRPATQALGAYSLGMDGPSAWDDAELLAAVDRYQEERSRGPLSPITVHSHVTYARRLLKWRTGEYFCDRDAGVHLPASACREA